jgi:hypothetical protein
MKRIDIIVSPQGEARIITTGFAGASCRQASRFLERALGEQTSEKLTAEFHRSAITHHQTEKES